MKKEGTGKPQNPDIALDADVRMRELRFEEAPDPEVNFRGTPGAPRYGRAGARTCRTR
jgi:hypothetical protein